MFEVEYQDDRYALERYHEEYQSQQKDTGKQGLAQNQCHC